MPIKITPEEETVIMTRRQNFAYASGYNRALYDTYAIIRAMRPDDRELSDKIMTLEKDAKP